MTTPISLKNIVQFEGHPGQFWTVFLDFVSTGVDASGWTLFQLQGAQWTVLLQKADQPPLFAAGQPAELQSFFASCQAQGSARIAHPQAPDLQLLGLSFEQPQPSALIAVFTLPQQAEQVLAEKLVSLQLCSDAPAIYQQFRTVRQNQTKLQFFAELLELLDRLNACEHFLAAAMQLVNSAVVSWRCSRVSLGWLERGYVKLQAISHMERFEPKMELVGRLEAAMEESLDQGEEIFYPAVTEDGLLVRDHEVYAKQQQVDYLLSFPLRFNGEVIAILTCERQEQAFSQEELLAVRITLDQVVTRLQELKKRARPPLVKVQDQLRERSAALLGPEHSLAKLVSLMIVLFLLLSVLVKIPYRVEAPVILRSADVRQVSTPVDGFIEQVHVKLGERVEQDQLLLTLDNRDLHLEESAAVANQLRYLREAEKARARGSLIDMKIAQAQTDQATAQLELIRHRLGQLQVRASIAGVVVEGELDELRGSPVTKGDLLFKLARHEQLYVELKIAERDVHEIAIGQQAKLAFIGQPKLKFPIVLEQLDPVAQAEEAGNVFLATGRTYQAQVDWWRPGMSGVAKIEVGERTILWVLSHRSLDFMRLLLWW